MYIKCDHMGKAAIIETICTEAAIWHADLEPAANIYLAMKYYILTEVNFSRLNNSEVVSGTKVQPSSQWPQTPVKHLDFFFSSVNFIRLNCGLFKYKAENVIITELLFRYAASHSWSYMLVICSISSTISKAGEGMWND